MQAPSPGKRRVATSVLINAVACIAALAFVYAFRGRFELNGARLSAPAEHLGLRAEFKAGGVLIKWDRNLPVVSSATKAVLKIEDGPDTHSVELLPEEIQNGSLFYRPSTPDVSIGFTVYSGENTPSTEYVRIVQPARQTASAPPNQTTPSPPTKQIASAPVARSSGVQPSHSEKKPPQSDRPVPAAAPKKQTDPPNRASSDPSIAQHRPALPAVTPAAQPKSPTDQDRVQSYVPPRPIKSFTPEVKFDQSLLAGVKQIQVEVDIDESGNVTAARPVAGSQTVNRLVWTAALSAAKRWVFEPARMGARNVPAQHRITFRFAGS